MKTILLSVGFMLVCVVVLVLAQVNSKQDAAVTATKVIPAQPALTTPIAKNIPLSTKIMSDDKVVTNPSGLKYVELQEGRCNSSTRTNC